MPRAQELNVHCLRRRTTFRVWHYVVEVQFILRTTDHTLPFVSFPNFHLDVRRDDPPPFFQGCLRVKHHFVALKVCLELELKDHASAIRLLPGVYKAKKAVVGPDSLFDLFVDPDPAGVTLSPFEGRCSLKEFAILCQFPEYALLWLVKALWVRNRCTA